MSDPDAHLIARLRFRHLALVESLGALRSIRKAARAQHISEPAVSKALAEIETSFGFRLFERSAAGVVPTPRGETVIEGATLLLNALRHVREAASRADARLALRLGTTPFIAISLFPRLLREIRALASNVEVTIREAPGPEIFRDLLEGEIDAMLLPMSPDVVDAAKAAMLTYTPLFTETLAVIAPAGHRLARRRQVAWSDLAAEAWVLPLAPSIVETTLHNAFLAQGVVPSTPWIRSQSPSTNVALVAAGLAVGIVPAPLVREAREQGTIVELRVTPPPRLPPVSLAYRSAAAQAGAIRILERALQATLPR